VSLSSLHSTTHGQLACSSGRIPFGAALPLAVTHRVERRRSLPCRACRHGVHRQFFGRSRRRNAPIWESSEGRRPEQRRNRTQQFVPFDRRPHHLTAHPPKDLGLQRRGERLSSGENHTNLRGLGVRPQVLQKLPAVVAPPPPAIEDDELGLGPLDQRVHIPLIVRAVAEGLIANGGGSRSCISARKEGFSSRMAMVGAVIGPSFRKHWMGRNERGAAVGHLPVGRLIVVSVARIA
jgi:hypothetical protein